MENALATVIIPTYKGDKKIVRAVDSVCEQTYRNTEVIVVDDNGVGTDEQRITEKLLEGYKNRKNFKYLVHERNRNGAAARNTGIDAAQGVYIGFLDDDDYYLPNRVEKSVFALEQNKDKSGVLVKVGIEEHGVITKAVEVKKDNNMVEQLLLNECVLGTGSNIFVRTSVVKELNGFDEAFLRNQDVEFMIRFYKKYNSVSLGEMLVIKSMNSTINIPSYPKMKHTKLLFHKKFENEINLLSDLKREQYYKNERRALFMSALLSDSRADKREIFNILKSYEELSIIDCIVYIMSVCGIYRPYIQWRIRK